MWCCFPPGSLPIWSVEKPCCSQVASPQQHQTWAATSSKVGRSRTFPVFAFLLEVDVTKCVPGSVKSESLQNWAAHCGLW
jgi:hypothetical protein